jgi:hypothetical protein
MKLIKFIIITLLLILANEIINNFNKKGLLENFSSSYHHCINSGYTKEFCLQTPTSVLGPNGCLCHDGSLGYLAPGFRGYCVCNI